MARAKDRLVADAPAAARGEDPDHRGRPEAWLTVADVATTLKVTVRTIRDWISSGYLPASRVGRRIRIAPDDLRAFIERHRIHKPPTKTQSNDYLG